MTNNKYYKGCIHIHTNLSDGSGNLKTIVEAAKKSGLDWIIITDHNYYDTEEGIFDGIYVIKGQEISPRLCNHYLALGVDETVEKSEQPQDYINKVREKGGFGFAAHPDEGMCINEKGEMYPRKNSHHCIPWTNKNITPDGIEIWNWFSSWADNLDDSNIFTLAYAYLFKHKIVKNPSRMTLEWWDRLNNDTIDIVPAIGGVDAHALKFYKYIIPVTVFPYKTCFNTITNFIKLEENLSTDFKKAKNQIFAALKAGKNIVFNRHICNNIPKIFIKSGDKICFCGETVTAGSNCYLYFESKEVMKICLVYNGNTINVFTTDKFIHPITTSGKYRLEVFYKDKGFLYTNPFIVKDIIDKNEQYR